MYHRSFQLRSFSLVLLAIILGNSLADAWAGNAPTEGESQSQEQSGTETPTSRIERRYEPFREMSVAELEKAVERKQWAAAFVLGKHFEESEGEGSPRALAMFKTGARQRDPKCLNTMGLYFENGDGVELNEESAARCYRAAAQLGYADSQFNLALCFGNGIGDPRDQEQAFYWYKRAADQGSVSAQVNLGHAYEFGEGTFKDLSKAIHLYRLAANAGDDCGQTNLGLMYLHGKGVKQDRDEAFKWLAKAATQGYANGQNSVGVCFAQGWGIPRNPEKAIRWFERAAKQGHEVAAKNLREMREMLADSGGSGQFRYQGWNGVPNRSNWDSSAPQQAEQDARRFMDAYRRGVSGNLGSIGLGF